MKNLTKINIAALIVAAAHVIIYFGLGAAIFKNMWYTSPAIPVIGGIIAFVPLTAELANIFVFKKRWLEICVLCVSPALSLGHFFVFTFVLSKLNYFFIEGKPYFITAGLAAVIVFFIFVFPRFSKLGKRISAITLSAVTAIICLVCLFDATPFYLRAGAAVFAVDDEYQIAFSTSHKSTGSVIVNGKTYYDQTNGENNVSTLHKISVPADELDSAKSYSVRSQSVTINSAYLPAHGAVIKKNYSFRPVDESDGLQIYNLSDTHECITGPANAAKWFGDGLDLLILNGDIINDVSSEYQISLIYKLANRVTGGTRPVIYTRGNHECNGRLAADFGKYVGCADIGFYYTVRFKSLSMIVLDTANDMGDDNALIRPIANFDSVRAGESKWLKEELEKQSAVPRLIVAHMAYPLSGYIAESCSWHEWARELVTLTNGKTNLALCGHSHKTDFAETGTTDNAVAQFAVLRGSIRSNKYPDKEGISPYEFTGTALEIKNGSADIKFTNAKGQIKGEYSWSL